jgi:hypothetical protein
MIPISEITSARYGNEQGDCIICSTSYNGDVVLDWTYPEWEELKKSGIVKDFVVDNSARIYEIKNELEKNDIASIRAIREGDTQRVHEWEQRQEELRAELRQLTT